MLQHQNRKAVKIEGHDTKNITAKKFEAILKWASKNQAVVCLDSADYLMIGSKKYGRQLPYPDHYQRSEEILRLIQEYANLEPELRVKFLLTSHTNEWLDIKADETIRNSLFNPALAEAYRHKVNFKMSEPENIAEFYTGFDEFTNWPQYLKNFVQIQIPTIIKNGFYTLWLNNNFQVEDLRADFLELFSIGQEYSLNELLFMTDFVELIDLNHEYFINLFNSEVFRARFHKLVMRSITLDEAQSEYFRERIANVEDQSDIARVTFELTKHQFFMRLLKIIKKK